VRVASRDMMVQCECGAQAFAAGLWSWRAAAYHQLFGGRYHTWTPDECSSRECLIVHARAGLEVDVEAVRAKLLEKMPDVIAGRKVADIRDPFPNAS
jgi:hypothetical protein